MDVATYSSISLGCPAIALTSLREAADFCCVIGMNDQFRARMGECTRAGSVQIRGNVWLASSEFLGPLLGKVIVYCGQYRPDAFDERIAAAVILSSPMDVPEL